MTFLRRAALLLTVTTLAQVGPSIGAHLADQAGMTELASTLNGYGTAEAAFIRRNTLKKSPVTGYRVIVVVGDDAGTDKVASVKVSVKSEGEAPPPITPSLVLPYRVTKDNGNKTFAAQLDFEGDAVNMKYTLTTVMLDAQGAQVGEAKTSTIAVEDDGDARVRTVSIRQVDETQFRVRVVVVGDEDGQVAGVQAIFTSDTEGPAPIPSEAALELTSTLDGKRVFGFTTLTFEDPRGALDEPYNMIIDLIDANGKSLGASEQTVVVEESMALELAAATEELGVCTDKKGELTGFANTSIESADALLEMTQSLNLIFGGNPEGASNENGKEVVESMNVLLHELRGLALEVTLD